MCRVLMYLGKPLSVADLLINPNNSLIKQSYAPTMMRVIQNLAGFGMACWHDDMPDRTQPLYYRTTALPFYDRNLASLSHNLTINMLLAHVRGVIYDERQVVTELNAHPFIFDDVNFILAHNGSLEGLNEIKYSLHKHITPKFSQQISGTTDSEWIYALFLSRVAMAHDPASVDAASQALHETLEILYQVRKEHDINIASPLNLFVSNGEALIATRFVFSYGYFPPGMQDEHFIYHSLWYTMGDRYQHDGNSFLMSDTDATNSIILASEPLTLDTTTWIEIPEYSLVVAQYNQKQQLQIHVSDIDVG